MSKQERRVVGSNESELLPWQRELEVAYFYLVKDQIGLKLAESGLEADALASRIATRTGNLVGILRFANEYGVKPVPDLIRLPSNAPRVRTYYFSQDNKVKNIRVKGRFRFLEREDYEHAETVDPKVWTKDIPKMDVLKQALMNLVPFESQRKIMGASITNSDPTEVV